MTTSVVARQAYQEVREDKHPIIFICGKDIAETLIANGYNTPELVRTLLVNEYLAGTIDKATFAERIERNNFV